MTVSALLVGCDFSSSPSTRKPIVVALGQAAQGRVQLRELLHFTAFAAFADWLKASPDAPGTEGVLLAGEPERAARVARGQAGIEVDDNTWAEIQAAGVKVGLRQ